MLNNYAINNLLRVLNNEDGLLILKPSVIKSSQNGTLKRLRELDEHYKLLVIPIHVNQNHWIIAFANRFTMRINIYNPLRLPLNFDQAITML